jgi:hypothetical protein
VRECGRVRIICMNLVNQITSSIELFLRQDSFLCIFHSRRSGVVGGTKMRSIVKEDVQIIEDVTNQEC